MDLFCVKPKVCFFEKFSDFSNEFNIQKNDLIITETIMYESYVKPLSLPCRIVLKDEYDRGEPNDETIDRILQDIAGVSINRIIAVGGGSVIDIAKMLIIKNAYPFADVVSGKTPIEPDKQLIVLPSTCGTGSEVTYGGIVTMKSTGLKTGIMSDKLTASYAVLVPELIENLPYKIFIYCSIDALGHSIESFLSASRGNEMARAVGQRSIELILNGYADIILNGEEYRKKLLSDFITASCLGGMAVNNGGAGPVHALAYPLGENYKMSHGESIYQFLIPVLRLYQREKQDGVLLSRLINIILPILKKVESDVTEQNAFTKLEKMLNKVYPARPLRDCGMAREDIVPFSKNIMATKQRLIVASYIPFTEQYAQEIYEERF